MKEYTLLAIISIPITVLLDNFLGTKILQRKVFYLFLTIIIFFKFLVNGFLTGKEIIIYSNKFYLGRRIGSIPIEDFLFGFSMVTMTIIFWEYFKNKT
jgi:lycopene cyclase domain-containing protein